MQKKIVFVVSASTPKVQLKRILENKRTEYNSVELSEEGNVIYIEAKGIKPEVIDWNRLVGDYKNTERILDGLQF